nr:ROK family transcriptional regulator [Vibrio sp. 99-8-1]
MVLEHIRNNPKITKAQLSSALDITFQGMTNIVNRLEKSQLITKVKCEYAGRGKPPIGFEIEPNSVYALGFHLDHEKLTVVLTNLEAEIIDEQIATCHYASPDVVMPMLEHYTSTLLAKHMIPTERFLGVSIAMSGPFNVPDLTSKGPTTHPGWQSIDLKSELTKRIKQPVFINNETSVAAMYQLLFDRTHYPDNFLYIYCGLGLGGGLILNGQPYLGTRGNAGEIGHIPVCEQFEQSCSCGNKGCLEQVFSLHAFYSQLKQKDIICNTTEMLEQLMNDDNEALKEILIDACSYLRKAIQFFENTLDLNTVFFAGILPSNVLTFISTQLQQLNPSIRNGTAINSRLRFQAISPTAIAHAAAVYPLFVVDNRKFNDILKL